MTVGQAQGYPALAFVLARPLSALLVLPLPLRPLLRPRPLLLRTPLLPLLRTLPLLLLRLTLPLLTTLFSLFLLPRCQTRHC